MLLPSFVMLSVTIKSITLSVVMLSVVILNVVAPSGKHSTPNPKMLGSNQATGYWRETMAIKIKRTIILYLKINQSVPIKKFDCSKNLLQLKISFQANLKEMIDICSFYSNYLPLIEA